MKPPELSTLPRWLLQETLANNGRYLSSFSREHVPRLAPQPHWRLQVPAERVLRFGDLDPLDMLAVQPPPMLAGLHPHASVPLLDAFARTLTGEGELTRAGWCWPTSSLRTVVCEQMGGWAMKLHLPDSLRARGMASKELTAADVAIAPVFSALLRREREHVSPFLGVVEEPGGVVATLRSGAEVGVIFRRLPDAELVPGFAIYSRPESPLPGRLPVGVELARAGSPDDVVDRCLALFVEPLLDIFFSLASRGITVQMHAQNILFEIDEASVATRRVWVRDMGGVNYAPEFRSARGLDDVLPAILEEVRGASPELLARWLERDGQRRRMFDERLMFGHSYDVHASAFWHQMLVGFWRAGLLRWRELEVVRRAIQTRAAAAAAHYDFDPALLLPRFPARQGLLGALVRGIARHPPFRPA